MQNGCLRWNEDKLPYDPKNIGAAKPQVGPAELKQEPNLSRILLSSVDHCRATRHFELRATALGEHWKDRMGHRSGVDVPAKRRFDERGCPSFHAAGLSHAYSWCSPPRTARAV